MDTEAVIEFLGNVPLLQRLPSSSLLRIAQVVNEKHYEKGEHIIREGEAGNGIFFIWEGEAEVSGSVDTADDGRPEFQLKRFDYFGLGAPSSEQADVIALSKLTCLVLSQTNCDLLKPKSIWNADKTDDSCAPVENILHLIPLEDNIFQGITLPEAPKFGKMFGGQFMGQALAAATKTVDCLKLVHSLHAYFLLIGDYNIPVIYQVYRIRDGKSFATRKVDAIQKGNVVFTLLASFQLLSMEELREKRITNPRLPRTYRNKVASSDFIPWPIEIRFCQPNNATNQTKAAPSLRYWFRAKGKLSDDPALHRCVAAYASDFIFLSVSLNPHRKKDLKLTSVSLDHAMWFHRPFRADDWLLFSIVSPAANNARGFCSGQMFNRNGELVVSLIQEGLVRPMKTQNPIAKPKL
ncbi:acyl-CoA hydrolase 2-like isoform X2 [Impatiens glandulifera]|uniref:acyl-CoA hydrolase 2-like isoform X2 n=1 Tax=Impatiens glandulifera TaxID=253017 RepID=UPI001FB0EB02|nr:acyl-CoA hydrolase 2-like isoform X2 [Impatiens glandulifera]